MDDENRELVTELARNSVKLLRERDEAMADAGRMFLTGVAVGIIIAVIFIKGIL